ncbi:hypothetical protein RFI_24970 [Reticulomyxa filosa]|uniref:Transmembrane protein n=1 Tax=Reticulomyxa filosa TaxID=46433 RepID=X6MFJ5_RETFI|nr:hypothetical protein RFI_24970 [Reticulomyxa filosa]|eukprot:ETO12406.1 hypothetical protein RFI_24970 [Reticulomyxa filosa]
MPIENLQSTKKRQNSIINVEIVNLYDSFFKFTYKVIQFFEQKPYKKIYIFICVISVIIVLSYMIILDCEFEILINMYLHVLHTNLTLSQKIKYCRISITGLRNNLQHKCQLKYVDFDNVLLNMENQSKAFAFKKKAKDNYQYYQKDIQFLLLLNYYCGWIIHSLYMHIYSMLQRKLNA